jgi:hypothetical protein
VLFQSCTLRWVVGVIGLKVVQRPCWLAWAEAGTHRMNRIM